MIREPCGWFLTRTDLFSLFAGGSTTISLPERLSSPCMYKSLKLQPCSVQQQLPYPVLVLSSEDRCLTLYFLFFFCYLFLLHLAGPSPALIPHSTFQPIFCQDDPQISCCSLNPRFDHLRQCCCHWSCSSVPPGPHYTRRTFANFRSSDLGFARRDEQRAATGNFLSRAREDFPNFRSI